MVAFEFIVAADFLTVGIEKKYFEKGLVDVMQKSNDTGSWERFFSDSSRSTMGPSNPNGNKIGEKSDWVAIVTRVEGSWSCEVCVCTLMLRRGGNNPKNYWAIYCVQEQF